MRTAILVGLLYVGDAIGTPAYMHTDTKVGEFFGVILVACMVMDVVDFLRNRA